MGYARAGSSPAFGTIKKNWPQSVKIAAFFVVQLKNINYQREPQVYPSWTIGVERENFLTISLPDGY